MTIRRNILANFLGQGWTALMNVAFVPVYVARLGVESYALIGVFATLQAAMALLDLGLSPTLGREMARHRAGTLSPRGAQEVLRSVELVCVALAVVAALTIAVLAGPASRGWFAGSLPPAVIRQALTIIGIVVAMRFVEAIYRSALYGLDRQVWYNGANAILATARFGGAAAIITFVEPTIAAFFWWQLAISAGALLLLGVTTHRALPPAADARRFAPSALRKISGFAGGMIAINLAALVLTQSDKVIVSRLEPLTAFGLYALAFTIANVMIACVTPVTQAIFPVLTRLSEERARATIETSYRTSSCLVAAITCLAGGMLMLFPQPVLLAWSGDAALAGRVAPVLRLVAAGTACNLLTQIPYFALLAAGDTRWPFRITALGAAIFVPGLLLVVPAHGIMGAAALWFAINALSCLIAIPLFQRRFLPGSPAGWPIRDIVSPIAGGLLSGAIAGVLLPAADTRLIALGIVPLAALAIAGGVFVGAPALRNRALALSRRTKPAEFAR